MEFVLHLIGFCPENPAHLDFLDIFYMMYSNGFKINNLIAFVKVFFK